MDQDLLKPSSPRWEDWNRAFVFLREQPGEWWIISPFITAAGLVEALGEELSGAHVLTTLDVKKLISDATSLDTLLAFRRMGATVRVLDDLHAKVYLKRTPTGAVGFIGSANLTLRAERRNLEVMTGPVKFDDTFVEQLDQYWARTEDQTLTEEWASELRQEVERQRALSGMRVFSVETRVLRGAFTLKQKYFQTGDTTSIQRLKAASVAYVPKTIRDTAKSILDRALKEALRGAPDGVGQRLSGEARLYAVTTEGAARWFQERMQQAETELQATMDELRRTQITAWRSAFAADLIHCLDRYIYQLPKEQKAALLEKGLQKFDKCLSDGEVQVVVNEYLPSLEQANNRHLKELQALSEKQTLLK